MQVDLRFRTALALTLASSLALVSAAAPCPAAEPPVVRIGTVLDGPPGEDNALPLFRREILALTEGELDVRFEPEHQLWGDWTLAGTRAAMDALLADPEVDLVIALGPLASHLFCCIEDVPKPVVAALVLDAELQALPRTPEGTSGVPKLVYVDRASTFESDLDAFLSVVPFHKVVVLAQGQLLAAIPGLEQRVRGIYQARGLDYGYVLVEDSVDAALAAVPEDTDAIYVTPLFQLPARERRRLFTELNERRIPTFSYLGEAEVEQGVLAGLGQETFLPRLARRVALDVQRILLGEEAGALPVAFPVRQQLTLNMATARQIGVYPTWDVLVEAVLLHREDSTIERQLTLAGAVEEAVEANLELLARGQGVRAGAEEERLATAALRPLVTLSTLGIWIDDERAGSPFATQAGRTLSGSLALSQPLWVEPLRANLTIQRRLQEALEADYETLRLDVAQAAATAYLNLLRAETLERIQRENLRVTRENLDLARVRRSVGTAGEAEVVRWESQIARDRQAVVDARVGVEQAQLVVNRLLNRPLEEPFRTLEVGVDDPGLIMSEDRLQIYTADPRRYELMRDFMVRDGGERAPELARLDALLAAKERQLTSARRAFVSPAVGLSAELSQRLAEGRAGAADSPPLLPGLDLAEPDTTWNLALSLSLPLFAGGERAAEVAQTDVELTELKVTRRAVAEAIELRIRSALFAANGSFQGIELSEKAAAAAHHNLELVSDAYARGVLSILDLLDAQNAALVADQVAANAVYDFLIDLMEVERAVNRFDFFAAPSERAAWLERLEAFLRASGIPLED